MLVMAAVMGIAIRVKVRAGAISVVVAAGAFRQDGVLDKLFGATVSVSEYVRRR